MQNSLYQCEEFGTSPQSAATIIFVCPFGTPIQRVRFAIRRLCWEGYHVVAYHDPMRRAGAEVSVREVPAIGHITAVIVGLWKGPHLVQMVRT